MMRFGSLCRWLALALVVLAIQSPARADDKKTDKNSLREKALALNDVTGDETIKGEIKALVDAPDAAKKLLAVAVPMAKEKDQPFNYNGAFILANAARVLKDLEASRTFFWVLAEQANMLQSQSKLQQSYAGLDIVIRLLQQDKKYDASAKLSQEFLEMMEKHGIVQEARGDVIVLLLRAWIKEGKLADANKMLDNYLKGHEDDWLRLKVKGQAKIEMDDYAEAARAYEAMLPLIDKDGKLKNRDKLKKAYKDDVLYRLSNIYIELEQVDKAIDALKSLLAEKGNEDNPSFNNDLGYVLADHDRDLDNAEKMIRKALDEDRKIRKKSKDDDELDPEDDHDSAAYLDSLGWVLFKKKNLPEAKKYLLLATKDKKEGQHVEILDHLVDVHLALGEKAEAQAVLKKAIVQEVTTKREKERQAKMKKKLEALEKK